MKSLIFIISVTIACHTQVFAQEVKVIKDCVLKAWELKQKMDE